MSLPLPPDPYAALGVPSNADLSTIRLAHRKLVLKHHPDRIRDEAEREKGKEEFQKIQQAYELLADGGERERYDNRLKLAELQKERMLRERESSRSSAYTDLPSTPIIRRGMKSDGQCYEERAPPMDYFESRDRYDEPVFRGSARKYDSFEKKASPAPKVVEKKEKSSFARYMAPEGVPIRIAMNLKAKATEARERTKENSQKKEVRDREKRRERSDKHSSRRGPTVEDDYSGSDSDTVVPKYSSKPSRTTSSRAGVSPEVEPPRTRASPPRRRHHEDGENSQEEYEKWERHHQASRDYIAQSQKRPGLARSGSDANHYWKGDTRGSRRSGDDSDKRPSSSRRPPVDEVRSRPSMPVHSSAPGNLRPQVIEREPQRAKTAAYPSERDQRREVPGLARSQTMPVPRSANRDSNVPSRGSNLKHAETQDSGYSSNSTPHTPEMRGDSPVREVPRETSRRQTSTKYAIVEPESEEETSRRPHLSRMVDSDSDERPRRYNKSPETIDRRDRDRPRDRPERPRLPRLDTDSRSRSSRGPEGRTSLPRGDFARYESQSPRNSPTAHRKGLFGEVGGDDRESSYGYRPEPANVRTASYRNPSYANYRVPRDVEDDHHPSSTFRQGVHGSRRSSTTAY